MTQNLKQVTAVVAILAVAVALAIGLYLLKPEPEQVTLEIQPVLIDVGVARKQALTVAVHSQGTVTPRIETTLVSEVAGKVVSIADSFEAGALVEKGSVLLQIDDRDYLAALKRAEAAVAAARSNLSQEKGRAAVAEKDLQNYPRKHVSEEARQLALRQPQLAEARAQLDAALADLERARSDLSRTRIRAPYRAMVRNRAVGVGQYLGVGSQLGQLFSVGSAEVRLPVALDKLSYLRLPSLTEKEVPTKVLFEDELGRQWRGRIVRSEGVLDERSRVLFLVAQIDDPYALSHSGPTLRMGSYLKARIQGRQFEKLVVVPRHILRTGNKLWVVDDAGQLRNREVKTLRTEGEFVYVSEGLQEGDRIALSALPNAVAGTAVRVNSETPSTALFRNEQSDITAARDGDVPNPS